MAHSAAPAAEHENLRNLNHSDIRDVADTMSDDDFFEHFADSPSSDHEQHEREDTELSAEAKRAAEDMNLDDGEEAAKEPRRARKTQASEDEADDADEAADEAPERTEEDEGEEEAEGEASPEAKDADKDAKPDRLNLRDDTTIVIDGQEINGAEVKRGFLRQADYTRKTQEVAQERQQVQALRQQIAAQEQELAQILDLATEVTRGVLPKPPAIENYDTNNPASLGQYIRDQQAYQQQIKGLETLVQSRQATVQQQEAQRRAELQAQQHESQQQMQARLQNELRLLQERIPELRTREGWNTLNADVEKYGNAWHLTPGDVNGLQDHRMYAVLKDALAYRKLQAAKPAAVKQVQAAPPIRPAARQSSGTRAADPNRSAQEAFRRNPNARTAAATLPDDWIL
jgi:hypothetical protein